MTDNNLRRGIQAYQAQNKQDGLLKKSIDEPQDSKIRRIAKFLILIGPDNASKIMAMLDPQQIEEISREITSVRGVSNEEADLILQEFKTLFSGSYPFLKTSTGGLDAARSILHTAYGSEKGEALLNRAVPESKANMFAFLEDFNAMQIHTLLDEESPPTAALILARLQPKTAAEVIKQYPPEIKKEILKRIARKSQVLPEVLERVAVVLREKARAFWSVNQLQDETKAIDGMKALTAILKHGDYSFGDRIITDLEKDSPDIGKKMKDSYYSLDDVLYVLDRVLAEKLKTMSDKDIAVLLKGRSGEFCQKILSNVSSGRRKLIREEFEIIGTVPKRDCIEAANEFLEWFRQEREDGNLILTNDEDWV